MVKFSDVPIGKLEDDKNSALKFKMYSDMPIKGACRFNFDKYSEVISKIILNKENETPFVIVINGKWGKGKTTLMRTIQEKLKTESVKDDYRKVKSVWFDAWKYSETDSMLAALVLEIFQEMGRPGWWDRIKAMLLGGKKINILKEFSDLANVLTLGKGPEFEKWFEDPEYKKKLSFYDLFQDYMEKILISFVLEKEEGDYNDKEGVLVIFIDDLDRCPPKQIVNVLESINLFFDQKGCFFIFGADISLISEAIDFEYEHLEGFSGIDYIKKMVQLQFDLPAIGEKDILEFVEEELIIEDDLKKYFYIVKKGFESNQREIKRFLNSVNLMRILGESIGEFKDELLIKWSILNFYSKDFIKEVDMNPKLMIEMQEISGKEKEEIEKYIEKLDESFKKLCNIFKDDEKIRKILSSGNEKFKESDIERYVFLSIVAPKEPSRVKVKKHLKETKDTLVEMIRYSPDPEEIAELLNSIREVDEGSARLIFNETKDLLAEKINASSHLGGIAELLNRVSWIDEGSAELILLETKDTLAEKIRYSTDIRETAEFLKHVRRINAEIARGLLIETKYTFSEKIRVDLHLGKIAELLNSVNWIDVEIARGLLTETKDTFSEKIRVNPHLGEIAELLISVNRIDVEIARGLLTETKDTIAEKIRESKDIMATRSLLDSVSSIDLKIAKNFL